MGASISSSADHDFSGALELVSFNTCPYVQRAVILLLAQGREFKLTSIDLANKPDWFMRISPLGKVPVLTLSDGTVLFESNVILEFLDETAPADKQLSPWGDPLLRAMNKAWIEYLGTVTGATYALLRSSSGERAGKLAELSKMLKHLEDANVIGGEFFNGPTVSLVDVVAAPAFVRMAYIEEASGTELFDRAALPRFAAWYANILEQPDVYRSLGVTTGIGAQAPRKDIDSTFKKLFFEGIAAKKADSFAAELSSSSS